MPYKKKNTPSGDILSCTGTLLLNSYWRKVYRVSHESSPLSREEREVLKKRSLIRAGSPESNPTIYRESFSNTGIPPLFRSYVFLSRIL